MATLGEARASAALATQHSWIANRPVEGRAGLRRAVNPATGTPFAQASLLDAGQAAAAIDVAVAAHPTWSTLPFAGRRRHLFAIHGALLDQSEELALLVAREQGKPPAEALAVEIIPALESLKHLALHAEEILGEEPVESQAILLAHKRCRISYASYGVVLVITPWNYPLYLPLSAAAAALAAGNTVVLKPAPATTLVGLALGALCRSAGLPEGVFNVVAVDDAVAPRLVEDPRVGKIVFVGSVATGKRVLAGAARNLTPVLLELGGKDPAVVCRDADVAQAARGIVWGAFANAGQTCVGVERVYVEEPIADAFVAAVVAETVKLKVGDPSSADTDVGPLTFARQREIVEQHVSDALARGARALTGGLRPAGPGFFYPPTVLVDVDHEMLVMREESFGPLLPVMRVPSLDEAIRLANDSPYGLTASGWTRSAETARRLQSELSAGVVSINDCVSSLGEPTAPYGGVKQSGYGRSHGAAGLREMARTKYLSGDDTRRPMLWWYPYGADLRRLLESAARALHDRRPLRRLAGQLGLLRFRRFRQRVNLLRLLRNADKLA
jgi:succinate-semialdehyde dehydrogenase/glutarate-semialdehyde dehydrogenase